MGNNYLAITCLNINKMIMKVATKHVINTEKHEYVSIYLEVATSGGRCACVRLTTKNQ